MIALGSGMIFTAIMAPVFVELFRKIAKTKYLKQI